MSDGRSGWQQMNHLQVITVALAAAGCTVEGENAEAIHLYDPERWQVRVLGRDATAAECGLAAVGYRVVPLPGGASFDGSQILELTLYGEED